MKEKDFNRYFDNEHLSDEAKALIADALLLNKEKMLPVAIRKHLESCLQCKNEVFTLYEIMKEDGVVQDTDIHPYLRLVEDKTNQFKVYHLIKIAAAVLLFVGLSILVYYAFTDRRNLVIPENKVAHYSDSLNKQDNNKIARDKNKKFRDTIALLKRTLNQEVLAENIEKSAFFENLITSSYRTGDVEVSFPPLNHKFVHGQAITFKINGKVAEPVDIIIYNNKGVKITERNNITKNVVVLNEKIPTGLYYWKLIKDYNVVQAGKFYVQ